jgi:hypothetical protein
MEWIILILKMQIFSILFYTSCTILLYFILNFLFVFCDSFNVKTFLTGKLDESTFTFDKIFEIHSKVVKDFDIVRVSFILK